MKSFILLVVLFGLSAATPSAKSTTTSRKYSEAELQLLSRMSARLDKGKSQVEQIRDAKVNLRKKYSKFVKKFIVFLVAYLERL